MQLLLWSLTQDLLKPSTNNLCQGPNDDLANSASIYQSHVSLEQWNRGYRPIIPRWFKGPCNVSIVLYSSMHHQASPLLQVYALQSKFSQHCSMVLPSRQGKHTRTLHRKHRVWDIYIQLLKEPWTKRKHVFFKGIFELQYYFSSFISFACQRSWWFPRAKLGAIWATSVDVNGLTGFFPTQNFKELKTAWWLNQAHLKKYMLKMEISSPNFSGVKIKKMLELPPSRQMGWKERKENIPLTVHQDWMEWQLSGFLRLNLHPLNHHLCLHKKMIQLIAAKMSSVYKKTSLLASHQKKQTTSHHSHYASQIH